MAADASIRGISLFSCCPVKPSDVGSELRRVDASGMPFIEIDGNALCERYLGKCRTKSMRVSTWFSLFAEAWVSQPPDRRGTKFSSLRTNGSKMFGLVRKLFRLPAFLVIGLIRLYQRLLSPLLPSACRFAPTCSEYAAQSIHRHGLFFGLWKGILRIARCNPFHPGGHDPVD